MKGLARIEGALPWVSLLTSAGTLVCCALPALLVSLGMGAVLAGLVSTVPQIVWLSEHKGLVFTVAGAMLAIAGYAIWWGRRQPCPVDPKLRRACLSGRRWSLAIYSIALLSFVAGAFFAFAAPYLL